MIDAKKYGQFEMLKNITNFRWIYLVIFFSFIFYYAGFRGDGLWSQYPMFVVFAATVFAANLLFFLILLFDSQGEKVESSISFFGVSQIIIDSLTFLMPILMTGKLTNLFLLFFTIPIVLSVLLFGARQAYYLVAFFSFVLLFVGLDKLYGHQITFLGVGYEGASTLDFSRIVAYVLFYFVVVKLVSLPIKALKIFEQRIEEQNAKLIKEKEYRENEWRQLDKATKLLVNRDQNLSMANDTLDKKLKDLKRSEKSMLSAFAELKEERAKTEQERDKTLAIISNFIDPIVVINNEGKIELVNPAARNILGFTDVHIGTEVDKANDYSMDNFKTLLPQEYEVRKMKKALETSVNEEELIVKLVDNQELTFKVITAKVIDRNSKEIGIMKIFYNLTRERTLDKLKSEFISIAAHQLRTPLSAIKWVIKMVLDGDAGALNPEQLDLLTKGYDSNERIIKLVNEMLDVSRMEEGRFGYAFAYEDLHEVINPVIDSIGIKLKEKNIKLTVEMPSELPKIYMDKTRINLAVQNLVENAIKYTPNMGKILVGVEVAGELLKVRVKDNGVGVPEKDQVKLFSKFFRATNVVRMQTEGSGLGLFIVKNVIKKHGGDITVSSKEGIGTEFVFTIPINQGQII